MFPDTDRTKKISSSYNPVGNVAPDSGTMVTAVPAAGGVVPKSITSVDGLTVVLAFISYLVP